MTAREFDGNGFMEIADNPLSKVGVFEYRGAMIDPSGAMGLKPDKVYSVYRSEEELSSPETLESFKLVPWFDDHEMVGEGFTPAESKGIHGVIGQNVRFEDGFLKGNIKLFSNEQAERVAAGKRELSCGYRCEYELKEGTFGDKKYTVVQTKIRGNHVASVDEGRMGSEVAVLDHLTFAIDTKDFEIMKSKTLAAIAEDGVEPNEVGSALQVIAQRLIAMDEKEEEEAAKKKAEDEEEETAKEKAEDEEEDPDKKKAEDEEEDPAKEKAEDTATADAVDALKDRVSTLTKDLKTQRREGVKTVMREIGTRDALYNKVSPATGAFVCDEMDTQEVAVYACDKLGLDVTEGHEITALDSYFKDRAPAQLFAQDSSQTPSGEPGAVDKHLAGGGNA